MGGERLYVRAVRSSVHNDQNLETHTQMEPSARREHPFLESTKFHVSRGQVLPRKRKRRIAEDAEDLEERRTAANTMERRRMERLNTALDRLREIIPSASEKRISKIKTLKMAIAYIDYLQNLLLYDEQVKWQQQVPYKYQQRYCDYNTSHAPYDSDSARYTFSSQQ